MTKTNVQLTPSNSQRHDTPNNKTHIIKFRVTAEEKTSLELTCKLLNLSLSTFIRHALHNAKIERTVVVAGGGEETLTAVSTLLAQCSRVGGNLNQLARHFNSGGADTEQIRAKILDELADLTAFRLHAEKVLGELYPTLPGLKSSCVAWRLWNRWCPVCRRKFCLGNSKSVMLICTASPELIFRTASKSCTRFCTQKTVRLRSRATHTTLESTTQRWKSLSGGFSRTLIF